MADENNEREPKKGGHTTKATLQAYIQDFSKEAIDGIVETMRNSRNDQLKFAAQKVIIERSVPALKAIELTGENGEPIKFNIIPGADYFAYLSKLREATTSSTTGHTGLSSAVQSSSVAQTSKKDDNSDSTVGDVGSA